MCSAPDATSILFVSEVKQPPVVSVIAVPGSLPVLGGAMQPLLGEIATGRLDDDPADLDPLKLRTPCDEFVLAFRAANQVFVATPCQNDGSANAYTGSAPLPVPMIKVDLSGCANLAVDRAFVVDAAPADGRLDVLITPMNGGRPCVVHGPFTFGKDSTPAAPALGAFSNEWMLEADERALMVDDVNGDGALDLVTTKGIFVSGACDPALGSSAHVGLCDATPFAFALPIAFARHGDLNGDHIEDVVIANGVSDRVWVELGAGDGTFASFLVETQNEFTGDMVVADFDGDGVDDLVYTDRLCAEITPDCQGSDTLSIAFGRTTMGPEPVVNFGRIGRIRQLVSARLRAQDGGFDGITDLGVLFTDLASPQETKVANLYGVSDRALQAPFAIVTQQGTSSVESTPVQLAQGVFVPRDGPPHGDLAIVTGHSETSEAPALWLLQAEGGAELSMARTCRTPIEGVSDTWLAGAFVTAHNLDDDPEDEVVLVGGNGFFIGDPRATPGGTCFHLDAITTHEFIDASILRNIEPVPRPVPVVLEDVNGDGFADVITLGVIPSGEEVLAIYWNEKGSFSADRRSAITVATDPKLFASAVIAVILDADVAKELVLVGPSFGIQRLDVNNALELTPAVLLFAPSDLPFAAPRTVNTGDFNHDGVPDLVFGSELMLSLYLGAPENVGVVK